MFAGNAPNKPTAGASNANQHTVGKGTQGLASKHCSKLRFTEIKSRSSRSSSRPSEIGSVSPICRRQISCWLCWPAFFIFALPLAQPIGHRRKANKTHHTWNYTRTICCFSFLLHSPRGMGSSSFFLLFTQTTTKPHSVSCDRRCAIKQLIYYLYHFPRNRSFREIMRCCIAAEYGKLLTGPLLRSL